MLPGQALGEYAMAQKEPLNEKHHIAFNRTSSETIFFLSTYSSICYENYMIVLNLTIIYQIH